MAEEELDREAVTPEFRIHTGQRKLRGLFFETVLADKTGVVYTLKDRDHAGYPSLYRLYMEADDPTEYTFAVQNLDGWDHWEVLCKCNWFKPYIERWRRELEIRTKAKALMNMRALASDPTSKDFHQANKFLVNGGWKDTPGSKRGRPSKEDIKKETQRLAQESSNMDDDLQRVTGVIN